MRINWYYFFSTLILSFGEKSEIFKDENITKYDAIWNVYDICIKREYFENPLSSLPKWESRW